MTFTAFPRPYGSGDPAVRLLYQTGEERITGITGTALTLSHAPIPGTLRLFKNGGLMDSGDAAVLTLDGATVTLGVAAVSGDVFLGYYHYRSTS